MSDRPPSLADRMRAYLDARPLDAAHPFQHHIREMDSITHETPVCSMLGIWARARKSWCAVTGEPLV